MTYGHKSGTWPSSTEAAIPPNELYLITKKDFIARQSLASIRVRISPIHQNRHFFTTVERITVVISVVFDINC
jgi:hypothetical protein